MNGRVRKLHEVVTKAGPAIGVVLCAAGFFLRDLRTMLAGFFFLILIIAAEISVLRREVAAIRTQIDSESMGRPARVPRL